MFAPAPIRSSRTTAREGEGRRPVLTGLALLLLGSLAVACGADGDGGHWFVDRTAESGLDFRFETGGSGEMHLPEITAGGAALFDADGDGDLDAYLTQGSHDPVAGSPDPERRNRFFRNEGGWRFVDATDASGLGDPGYGMGVATGDIDNDGDIDVHVSNLGRDALYVNDGQGRFREQSQDAGLNSDGWSASATFCDYDADGLLDLYVTQYVIYDDPPPCTDAIGRRDYCGPQNFDFPSDRLFHNEGGGRFADVSAEAGIEVTAGPGLGVVCEDFDGDGRQDFFVANDGHVNHLWRNVDGQRFEEIAVRAGVGYNMQGLDEAGMGVVAEDFDADGWVDLFLTHLRNETNTLYRNLGGEMGFLDSTQQHFPGAPSNPFTGFGILPMDVDLDGDIDLVVANGGVRNGSDLSEFEDLSGLPAPFDRYVEPNHVYLNDGQGRFELLPAERCGMCSDLEISRGLAFGDLDGDADLDILVSNIESSARLFENRAPRQGSWLGLRASDPEFGREAIGARVTLRGDFGARSRTVRANHGYTSSSDTRLVFGIPKGDAVDAVEVRWPDGFEERFEVDCVDCDRHLLRGQGLPIP